VAEALGTPRSLRYRRPYLQDCSPSCRQYSWQLRWGENRKHWSRPQRLQRLQWRPTKSMKCSMRRPRVTYLIGYVRISGRPTPSFRSTFGEKKSPEVGALSLTALERELGSDFVLPANLNPSRWLWPARAVPGYSWIARCCYCSPYLGCSSEAGT
jgi:hypothetical protein